MKQMVPIKSSVKELYTGYFAAVMATGIVSIALQLTGHLLLSTVLFYTAIVLYVVLTIAYLLRLVWFPRLVWRDLTDATKVFGYFTFVAATDVVGTAFVLRGGVLVPLCLGIIGVTSWCLLMYFILMFLVFYNTDPIEHAINGGWLVTTVGVESLAALGSAMADTFPTHSAGLLLASTAFWGLGIIIYLIFIALIMYRFFFHPINPGDLSPPYWINMGAMAITTLAGSRLILYPHWSSFLLLTRPFIEGFTFMLWVWGSWWIPLLLLIGVWKFVVFREPLRYEASLWSIVFPLGMYTAATDTMSHVNGLSVVHLIVPWGLDAAVLAWVLAVGGYCASFLMKCPVQIPHLKLRKRSP